MKSTNFVKNLYGNAKSLPEKKLEFQIQFFYIMKQTFLKTQSDFLSHLNDKSDPVVIINKKKFVIIVLELNV